nr:transketolase [Spiractinospora alimapuensis]
MSIPVLPPRPLSPTPMRDSTASVISHAMDDDERVAVLLADISTDRYARAAGRHPHRVINVGIREQLLVSAAGGLALTGMRPVVHTFSSFLVERPFEQLKLDLGHQGVGAVVVGIGGSYDVSAAGRTHMAPGDVALLDTLPGWTVHVPGHAEEADAHVLSALASDERVYVRLSSRGNAASHSWGPNLVTVREGSAHSAGVVVAVGPMLDRVLTATRELDVTVLYTSTVRPFDRAGLNRAVAAAGTADVLVVEPYLAGTSAHEIAAALRDHPHRQLGLGVSRDMELRRYGTPEEHDTAHGLDVEGIATAAGTFFRR